MSTPPTLKMIAVTFMDVPADPAHPARSLLWRRHSPACLRFLRNALEVLVINKALLIARTSSNWPPVKGFQRGPLSRRVGGHSCMCTTSCPVRPWTPRDPFTAVGVIWSSSELSAVMYAEFADLPQVNRRTIFGGQDDDATPTLTGRCLNAYQA